VAKSKKDTYNKPMDYIGDIEEKMKDLSGQQLNNFIETIHDEYKHAVKEKQPPYITLYYRDLLSFLIKTYGH
jgi:hypothetical protein